MSYIFDALQKSEAERSGVDRGALAAATEVLQAAERQAAAERDASVTSASSEQLTGVVDRETTNEIEAGGSADESAAGRPVQPVPVAASHGSATEPLGLRDRQGKSGGRKIPVSCGPLAADATNPSTQEGVGHELRSAGREEHGGGEPGLHAGEESAAQNAAPRRRFEATVLVQRVRTRQDSGHLRMAARRQWACGKYLSPRRGGIVDLAGG